VIEDRVTIARVKPDSPAQKAGLKPGDVVRRAGTVVLSEMAATMSESVDSPRKRMLYLRGFVNWWLSAAVGKEIVLEVEDVAGVVREVKIVSVSFEGIWSEPMGFCPSEPIEEEVSRGPDGVLYLRFNVFALPAMNEFKRCVHSLKEGEGLIIDLRGNAGGLTLMAPGIFGRLSAKEVSLGTMHRRYGTEEFTAYPQRGAFLGPVAVLVDSASASTSEILAAGLQETGRARIFGETTAGAALPSMFRNLPTGDMLQYAVADIKTPHGMLLEGNGVTPDEPVALRRADCAVGRDPVREAAEHWLATQRQTPATEVASK
jgi:carboxyl-terminal processing protease